QVLHSAATWAEYALASERVVLRMPKDVATDVTAIIGCAVMTGAGAIINTLQVRPGESVAVFGAGGIGLCAIAAAAIVDAYPIVAVDVSGEKLAFARRFGASHTVDSRTNDAVKAVQELSGGSVDYAIDAVGLPETQEQILRAVRMGYSGLNRGGTALVIGVTPPGEKAMLESSWFSGHRRFTRPSGRGFQPGPG